METKKQILGALKKSKEPLKIAQIVEATGLDKKDVDKAIKELKKDGTVVSPKNCFYSVP